MITNESIAKRQRSARSARRIAIGNAIASAAGYRDALQRRAEDRGADRRRRQRVHSGVETPQQAESGSGECEEQSAAGAHEAEDAEDREVDRSEAVVGNTGTSPAPIAQSAMIAAAVAPPRVAQTSAAISAISASVAASRTVSRRRVRSGEGGSPRTSASRPPSYARPCRTKTSV